MSADFASQNTIPFAVGSLTGIRCWRVHRDGSLQAVNHAYRYTPGENKAHCAMGLPNGSISVYTGEQIGHHPGVFWCSCGFYGYYAGNEYTYNQYAGYETVTGLVQAYGRCSYGKNGFRAEKLKILAIVNPFLTEGEVTQQAKVDQARDLRQEIPKVPRRRRLKKWYFRGWKPFVLPLFFALWFIMGTATLNYRETNQGKVIQSFSGILAFAIAIGLFHIVLRQKSSMMMQRLMESGDDIEITPDCLLPENTHLTRRDYTRIKNRYPNVPHYRSVEEALKIFPLTNYHNDTPGGRRRLR